MIRRRSTKTAAIGGVGATLALTVAGCAATGRDNAQHLAAAGLRTSWILSQDVGGMSRQLAEGDAAMAFAATWSACKDKPTACAVTAPDPAVQAQRAELARAVLQRSQALAALHRAYAAFRKEVEPGAAPDAGASIQAAATEAGAYASAVTVQELGMGGARLLSKSLMGGMRLLASAGSRGAQQRRIDRSSTGLAATLGTLGGALERETRMFDALAEVLVREKIEAHRALLQAGVVSGSEALRPVADSLRLSLSRDADATVAKSPGVRMATQAALEASERAQIRSLQLRYRAALAAVRELQALHGRLNLDEPLQLERLEEELSTIEALLGPRPAENTVASLGRVASSKP